MKAEDDAVTVLKHSVLRQYNWGNLIMIYNYCNGRKLDIKSLFNRP